LEADESQVRKHLHRPLRDCIVRAALQQSVLYQPISRGNER
jgi:hypothetical protein